MLIRLLQKETRIVRHFFHKPFVSLTSFATGRAIL
jgi:hypothetical protein